MKRPRSRGRHASAHELVLSHIVWDIWIRIGPQGERELKRQIRNVGEDLPGALSVSERGDEVVYCGRQM